jgi:sortase B
MDQRLKKAGIFLDRVTDSVMTLFCIIIFLIGVYRFYDYAYIFNNAQDKSMMRFKPDYESDDAEITLPDSVAWLMLEDTSVDYPVMQGKDNLEYINKNPYGEYSISGSVFLDTRNSSDFTDDYNLVYGHHMESGLMFGSLDKYLDENYLDGHRNGVLVTKDSTYKIDVFAAVRVVSTDSLVFSPEEHSNEEIIKMLEKDADVFRRPKDGPILALSTCTNNIPDNRLVVMCTIQK